MIYGKGKKHKGMVTAKTGDLARGHKVLKNPSKSEIARVVNKVTKPKFR